MGNKSMKFLLLLVGLLWLYHPAGGNSYGELRARIALVIAGNARQNADKSATFPQQVKSIKNFVLVKLKAGST